MVRILLNDAVDEFLTYLKVELNRSAATQKGYQKDLKSMLAFLRSNSLHEITLDELSHELFSDYLRYLVKDRGCQPATLRRHITAIKSFCNFLVDNEYMDKNLAAELSWPRRSQKKPRFLQKEELERLFNAVPDDGSPSMIRDKTILMFLYYTGVRLGELVSVLAVNVGLADGFARIVKGKSGRYRKVPLHRKLKEQLCHFLKSAPELTNGYLFCNKEGTPVSADYVHYMVALYAKKADLTKTVTPHTMRHTFATHLYRKGADLFVLGELMGHARLRSTAIYIHTDLKHLREGVEQLNVCRKIEAEIAKMEGVTDGT